jgi:hypothetical protein
MDLLGKEFISVEFIDKRLVWSDAYIETLGKTGKIINLHPDFPEYVCIDFGNKKLHWHIDVVTKQILDIERLNPEYTNILYKEIFKAIKEICQNKRR